MISQQFVIKKSSHSINSAHSELLKIPTVQCRSTGSGFDDVCWWDSGGEEAAVGNSL